MNEFFKTWYRRNIIFTAVIEVVLLLVFLKNPWDKMLGFLLGSCTSMFFLWLMYRDLDKSLDFGGKFARRKAVTGYLFRYLIYALLLVLAAKSPYLNFYTTALGFLTMKVVIVGVQILEYIKGRERR